MLLVCDHIPVLVQKRSLVSATMAGGSAAAPLGDHTAAPGGGMATGMAKLAEKGEPRTVRIRRGRHGFGITLTEGTTADNLKGIFITNISPDSPIAQVREGCFWLEHRFAEDACHETID